MLVILLPGWMHNQNHWNAVCSQLDTLKTKYSFIEFPGFGADPADPLLTDVDAVTAWLHKKLSVVDEPFMLCGHSFGGRVAVAYQATYPERVSSLCLIGSPNLYLPSPLTRIKKTVVAILKPARSFIPEFLRSKIRSSDFDAVRGTSLELLFKNVIAHDQINLLRNIAIETYLLWGADDEAVPLRVAEKINQCLHNSKLDVVPHSGHNLHIEKPALTAAKITEYAKNY